MERPSVLIIDDDEGMRDTLEAILRHDHRVFKAASGEQGLAFLKNWEVSLVLLDVRMPDMDGLEVLREINRLYPGVMVVIISIVTDPDTVTQALELGARDYLTKEFDYDSVRRRCRQLLELREKERELVSLKSALESHLSTDLVLGPDPGMRRLYESLPGLGTISSPILLAGETGTGKELWARCIHSRSPRKDKPFITTNLAAIPADLVASALFGHQAGAFTGATQHRLGKFELAHEGTLFLDEIGSMELRSQGKLLRVLETGELEKLGEARTKRVEVKVIAATNVDLGQAVTAGRFREDLYYRLNNYRIHLPPLRDRKDDLPLLVPHFIAKYNRELNQAVEGIEPEALRILCDYYWPGNVRELENLIERLVLTARGKRITRVDLLFNEFLPSKQEKESTALDLSRGLKESLQCHEKRYLEELLGHCRGNVRAAARDAQISRRSFYQKMKQHGIGPGR